MIVKSEGIVLRSIRYGDTSRIVTAYTQGHGRTTLIAKAAAGPKPRFGAALELFAHSQFVYYHKASREIQLLSQADVIESFRGMQADMDKTLLGFAVLEFVLSSVRGEEQHPGLFSLLLETLRGIDTAKTDPANILLRFLVHFSAALGFGMEMRTCHRCGADIVSEGPTGALFRFTPSEGAFACPSCSEEVAGMNVPAEVVRVLQAVSAAGCTESTAHPHSPATFSIALRLLHRHLAFHVQGLRRVHALEMLSRNKREYG
ncbi:MAG: DNA repair protein RecO [Bacteroidota bacterium]|nr:DNA repair protein RecO [Bacteroidota bacterium]